MGAGSLLVGERDWSWSESVGVRQSVTSASTSLPVSILAELLRLGAIRRFRADAHPGGRGVVIGALVDKMETTVRQAESMTYGPTEDDDLCIDL